MGGGAIGFSHITRTIVVMSDDSSSRGTCKKPFLTSTSERHLAWQSLWTCSESVGIWYRGLRIPLLNVWVGSMQILVFFGVSLMSTTRWVPLLSLWYQLQRIGQGPSFLWCVWLRGIDGLAFVLYVIRQLLLRSVVGFPSSQGLRNSQDTVVVCLPLWVLQVGPGVFWKGSLWVWRVKALLGPHTACSCWVDQDGSLLLPWEYSWFELLGCLGPDWFVTSWLDLACGVFYCWCEGKYFVCFDSDDPQCLTVGPREKDWFVHHNVSRNYLVCERLVSFVPSAQKVNLPQWFCQWLGIAIGVK